MRRVDSRPGKLRKAVFLLTALLVVATDQLSKLGIRTNLAGGEALLEVGPFRLIHVYNTGAAFGLFQDQSFFLTIVALIAVVVLLLFTLLFSRRFTFFDNQLAKLALGLVLGGTMGNLIDRLRLGQVTDFISIGIWPAFNLADSAIVVGIIMLSYFFWTQTKKPDDVG